MVFDGFDTFSTGLRAIGGGRSKERDDGCGRTPRFSRSDRSLLWFIK